LHREHINQGFWILQIQKKMYTTFSVFLDDAYLDYSNLLPKNSAKFGDIAKMLGVIRAECENNFSL